MAEPSAGSGVRYEPDERPPLPLTLGSGLQAAVVIVTPVVITVAIVARITGQPDAYIAFAALLVSGATTVLQAVRVGRIGSGHVLIMGTSGAFIAVCVAALEEGGPPLMASLIVVSSLVQFALAARLALLRRIFTPVVSGTVIMLIAATVLPVVFETLREVPEDAPEGAAPLVALTTLLVVLAIVLRGPPAWRLWAPVIGIAAGCAVAVPFGLYDAAPVTDAAWLGAPLGDWPGLDLAPGTAFWMLLPAFVVVTIVGTVETVGDGIAIQHVSRRRPRATDFHTVQGALNADGVGNLLSGLLGTLPNTTYSSSIAIAEVTGVAARRVGVALGAVLLALAFLPKATALRVRGWLMARAQRPQGYGRACRRSDHWTTSRSGFASRACASSPASSRAARSRPPAFRLAARPISETTGRDTGVERPGSDRAATAARKPLRCPNAGTRSTRA